MLKIYIIYSQYFIVEIFYYFLYLSSYSLCPVCCRWCTYGTLPLFRWL